MGYQYKLGSRWLSAIYAPHYGTRNPFAAFGFYLSVPLAR